MNTAESGTVITDAKTTRASRGAERVDNERLNQLQLRKHRIHGGFRLLDRAIEEGNGLRQQFPPSSKVCWRNVLTSLHHILTR